MQMSHGELQRPLRQVNSWLPNSLGASERNAAVGLEFLSGWPNYATVWWEERRQREETQRGMHLN